MSTQTAENKKPVVLRIGFSKAETPVFKELRGKPWVYYGENNDYPDYLLGLYNLSSKHNAITDSKAAYVFAEGMSYDETKIPSEQKAAFEKFFKAINPNESLNDLYEKIGKDMEIFNGFAVEAIPNATKTGIATFYHVDFSRVRSNESGTEFYYCKKWYTKKDGVCYPNNKVHLEKSFKKYAAFKKMPQYTEERYLIYFQAYRPNMDVYPLPPYIGATSAIETDIRITNFHLSNIKNGFFASKLINFNNGVPTPDQQDNLESAIKDKFTGDESAGSFVLFFNDGTEKAATVLDLTAGDLDKQFEQLRKDTDQEIFIGHRITSPMLFGVKTEGQLGGRNELTESFELFKKGYITHRHVVFKRFFNWLAEIKGLPKALFPTEPKAIDSVINISDQMISDSLDKAEIRSLIETQFGISLETKQQVTVPVIDRLNTLSPLVANKILDSMTRNQLLEIVGLPPVPGGDVPAATNPSGSEMKVELNDERDVPIFLKYGTPKESFERVYSRPMEFSKTMAFDDKLAPITPSEREILKEIEKGKDPGIENRTVKKLRDKNLVEVKRDGTVELTDLGELAIADIPELKEKDLTQLKVVYEYTKRPGESGPDVIATTRPFCKALCDSNKYFTKEDISMIGSEVGYDVWKYRGGWITLDDGNHRPSCRHIWQQVLVSEIVK